MGLVHSACLRPFSAIQSIGESYDPEFSIDEVFRAIEQGDADRVSHLLEENHFDLTLRDATTGDTMLHRAIEYGHSDVVARLLTHAAQDPAVLNAQDGYRFTPLVRAAVMQNVPLMQVLFNEGGRVDDPGLTTWLMTWKPGQRYGWQLAAEFLVRAQGDLSEALKLAVQYRQPGIASMYCSAGASCIPALSLGAQAIHWMSSCGCLRAEDMLAVLAYAQRSGDFETRNALLSSDTVCEAIYSMADQSDKSTAGLIRLFVAAGADEEALVSTAVDRYQRSGQAKGCCHADDHGKFKSKGLRVLRSLVSAGLPTAQELVKQSRRDDFPMMAALIESGADVLGALPQLESTAAANLACLALNSILRKRGLPEASKAEELQAIIRNGGADSAADLARLLSNRSESLADAALLIRCGATLSAALMMALAGRVYNAEQDRALGQAAGTSPERRMFRQFVEAKFDFSPAIAALHYENAICATSNGSPGGLTPQDAINVIQYAQLQHLLSSPSLSVKDKIVEVKAMISQDAKQAAGKLLRDAVLANHAATVKLLVLAGAPVTEIFVELSRQLLPAESEPLLRTEALLRLGADFQPALRQLAENVNAYTAAGDPVSAEQEREALRQLGFTVALVMQRPVVKST